MKKRWIYIKNWNMLTIYGSIMHISLAYSSGLLSRSYYFVWYIKGTNHTDKSTNTKRNPGMTNYKIETLDAAMLWWLLSLVQMGCGISMKLRFGPSIGVKEVAQCWVESMLMLLRTELFSYHSFTSTFHQDY